MSIVVPAGRVLRYGYVPHGCIAFEHYGGIYLPAVQAHLDAIVSLDDGAQPAECPFGRWDEDRFVIQDGRHRYLALVIAGFASLLVRWLDVDAATAGALPTT